MSPRIASLLSLIAVNLLTSSVFAADRAEITFPADIVSAPTLSAPQVGASVAIGNSREAVLEKLGQPTTQLSPNGWMYEYVDLTLAGEAQPEFAHLVVVFSNDKVTSIRVVSHQARSWLLAQAASESTANAGAVASSH